MVKYSAFKPSLSNCFQIDSTCAPYITGGDKFAGFATAFIVYAVNAILYADMNGYTTHVEMALTKVWGGGGARQGASSSTPA